MKKTLVILFILFGFTIYSQEFNPKTINLSQNPEITDFSFLKEELKDIQVVMLGENTHFDGNVFEMKTKIVQYLHQEMGFNTIAFESGIYDVWKAQKNIEKGQNVKESLSNSLFSIWAKRNEFQSFIEFYNQNKKNLNLFGFDYQITGKNGTVNLSKDFFNYSKRINYKLKLKQEDFELLLESITNSGMFDEEDISYEQFKTELTSFKTKISQQKDSEEKFYWNQIVKSLLELGYDAISKEEISSTFNTTSYDNIRDKQMADNLLAYLKQNPEAKIICWGANVHFVNNKSSITEPILKEFVPMGSYIKGELKSKVYSLAAVTAEDSIYLQNKWHKTPIKKHSFEYFLKEKNASPHVFISSNQIGMQILAWNRLFSPITFVESKLNELHDGYLYFRSVTPSTIIDSDEENKVSKTKDILTANLSEPNDDELKKRELNEVVIYGKRTAYQIMKSVIESLEKNYPDNPFNSSMKTNIQAKIATITYLDFDFFAEQYDLGYVNHINRSTKNIKELRWNKKGDFLSDNLREYHGLMYNCPIKYAPFLKKGKFQKFIFQIEETKMYNNEEVFVINYSSPRNHSTFTRRVFLSDYSGYLYVNKKDFAIVKIFENWSVTEFPEHFREGFNLKNSLSKYTSKEYKNESILTDFTKIGEYYFITQSTSVLCGNVYNNTSDKDEFEIIVNSNWNDFNIQNPIQIKNKEEEHSFEKVKYNAGFWNDFKF
ncbi:MAG: erythromycin esterase family protein [Flavobacterium sp.]|uniref:erythromycin esterase family protein n=1 Tax=Flavobacterium sp. TaxID=239 RepID=UPI0025BF0724|nr:erythromycin esterase family protein [Flavobacterium sp.]MCK6606697.1 erythromycin esterase family protein [Flavobacterium sp.]